MIGIIDYVIWLPKPKPHERSRAMPGSRSGKICRSCGRPIKANASLCKRCNERMKSGTDTDQSEEVKEA